MRLFSQAAIVLTCLLEILFAAGHAEAATHATTKVCHLKVAPGTFGNSQGTKTTVVCGAGNSSSGDADNLPYTHVRYIQCGIPGVAASARTGEDICGHAQPCMVQDPTSGDLKAIGASAEVGVLNGTLQLIGEPWCPTPVRPMPTAAQLRQHAIRLLPTVAIGTGWGGDGLINAETILWANTPPERTLPDATIVGRDVSFRIHLHAAHWTFGDGTTATWHTPGTPYDATGNPCNTAQCPDYQGHTEPSPVQ